MTESSEAPCAVVLAAGLSTRMGQPKMLLPWGDKTVIEEVVTIVLAGGIQHIVVVTGSGHEKMGDLLAGYPVKVIFNPQFADGEMLHSFQMGIAALDITCQAALIVLGDQPQIQVSTVKAVVEEYKKNPAPLIIPSFQMRRGHPWIVRQDLWGEILVIQPPITLRNFLQTHTGDIHYLDLNSETILSDLDTPEDYNKYRP
jgi:molybdenum cofactor cytidylyltransferase